jgi:hypothetical protein
MLENVYVAHAIMLLAALGAVAFVIPQSHGHRVKRWRLLMPGGLAAFSALVLIAYPDFADLRQFDMWTFGLCTTLVGAVRGRFIGMQVDQRWNLVRVRHAPDGRWAALLLALFTLVQFVIELTLPEDHPYDPTIEFVMIVFGGYLLGRSIAAWSHSRYIDHTDLHEP